MSELHQSIRHALDGLVGERAEHGNWTRVVADAGRSGRRARVLRLTVVAAAAVAVVGAALVSPFEDSRPPGVIDRALAAIGDGPVIHLITKGSYGGTLVDMSSGEVTPVDAQSEVWYDPGRGAHYISRFGNRVRSSVVVPPDQVGARQADKLVALANRYRDELKSGKARVVGRGSVGERSVLWIRLQGERYPDAEDGREHLRAEEVAVDSDTYEPLYMRWTLDGRPTPNSGQLIVKLETLPAGEGDFDADEAGQAPSGSAGSGPARDLTRKELEGALDGKAVWLGAVYDGKPLVESRVIEFRSRQDPADEWETVEGISLFYGSLLTRRGGIRLRDNDSPFVQIIQATVRSPAWNAGELVEDVPEGSVLLDPARAAILRSGGVYVSISARRSVREALEAAAALRPVGGAAPTPSSLDLGQIAATVESRELVRVEGSAPVRPRLLVPRPGRRLQATESQGVKLAVFSRGVARFDTRGMDRGLQRVLPRTLGARCFRVRGGAQSNGSGGPIPRNGVKNLVMLAIPQHGTTRIVRGRFDGCEIATGLGRNWLRRLDWHGPLELPLTQRGVRFFDERAATRRTRADRN
jgi:hypothetical protein